MEAWLARDEDGSLYLFFREKPQKKMESLWNNQIDSWIEIDSHLFPEVKWSEEEPTKVKIVIEK